MFEEENYTMRVALAEELGRQCSDLGCDLVCSGDVVGVWDVRMSELLGTIQFGPLSVTTTVNTDVLLKADINDRVKIVRSKYSYLTMTYDDPELYDRLKEAVLVFARN